MELQTRPVNAVRMAQAPRRWRKTFLRDWREFRGLSLESVSAQMGLTHGQLSKIERGLHPYSQHVLEVAALEYGCSVPDLLSRAPGEADQKTAKTSRKTG
jgi:transcriptional regulator with XRE-family HTH domain